LVQAEVEQNAQRCLACHRAQKSLLDGGKSTKSIRQFALAGSRPLVDSVVAK